MCELNEQPTRLFTSTPLKSLLLSMIVLVFDVVSIMSYLHPVISTVKDDDDDDLNVEFKSSPKRISSKCSPSLSPALVINPASVASTPSHLRAEYLLQFVIFLDLNLSVRSSQGSAVGI